MRRSVGPKGGLGMPSIVSRIRFRIPPNYTKEPPTDKTKNVNEALSEPSAGNHLLSLPPPCRPLAVP